MSSEDLSNEDLEMVAKHGSGPMERALALVQLKRREDELEDLKAEVQGG